MSFHLVAISLLALALVSPLAGAGPAGAYNYEMADLVLEGQDWSASGSRQWYLDSDTGATYTNWSGWVEYQVYLTAGNWNFGLEAVNRGYLGTDWYSAFRIRDSITGQVMKVPASDSDPAVVFRNVDIMSDGLYKVRFSWLNDKWDPNLSRTHDANIQINKVFFDNTATTPGTGAPEPGTLLLLGSALAGAAAWRRRRSWLGILLGQLK